MAPGAPAKALRYLFSRSTAKYRKALPPFRIAPVATPPRCATPSVAVCPELRSDLCSVMRPHPAVTIAEIEERGGNGLSPDVVTREGSPIRRLGLTWLDEQHATSFLTSGSTKQVLEEIRARAEALAGPDGTPVRRRTLAKALAICNSQLSFLQTMQGNALRAQNFKCGFRSIVNAGIGTS